MDFQDEMTDLFFFLYKEALCSESDNNKSHWLKFPFFSEGWKPSFYLDFPSMEGQ